MSNNPFSISLTFLLCIFMINSTWRAPPTPKLPRPDSRMSVGYYSDTIWLLGGISYSKQLVQYDIPQNTFINNGTSVLSDNTFGWSQFYTQINHQLFIIDPDGEKLSMYDLQTNIFINYWNNINIPIHVASHGCLASNHEYIFVVGGWNANDAIFLDTLQTLNLSTNKWISTSSMNEKRGHLSCNLHASTNRLYVIGGYEGTSPFHNTVEIMSIDGNISSNKWTYNDYNLLYPTRSHRSIIHQIYIFVIGGEDGPNYIDEIQIIDTGTGQISSGGFLNYSVRSTAAIIANNIIYVFGGWNGDILNIWQYSIVGPTPSPTLSPTQNPAKSPTNIPTEATLNSTPNPSATLSPTQNPSNSGVIIGIVIGIIFGLIICGFIGFYIIKNKKYQRIPAERDQTREQTVYDDNEGLDNNIDDNSHNTAYIG